MANRHSQGIGKFLASSKVLFLISLFILIFFSVNLTKEIIDRQDLQSDIDKLEAEITGLENRNQELLSLIDYFKSLDFVEEEARTKLNLRKPGEKIIIVPEEKEARSETSQALSEFFNSEQTGLANPARWWNHFFK